MICEKQMDQQGLQLRLWVEQEEARPGPVKVCKFKAGRRGLSWSRVRNYPPVQGTRVQSWSGKIPRDTGPSAVCTASPLSLCSVTKRSHRYEKPTHRNSGVTLLTATSVARKEQAGKLRQGSERSSSSGRSGRGVTGGRGKRAHQGGEGTRAGAKDAGHESRR